MSGFGGQQRVGASGSASTTSTQPTSATVNNGTGYPKYRETIEKEEVTAVSMPKFHSISLMPQYRNWSFEELRLKDYEFGRKFNSTSVTAAAGGAFGAAAPGTTSAFGAQSAGGMFGKPTVTTATGGFGSTATGGFGSTAASTGGFGSAFGQQQNLKNQATGFGGFGINNAAPTNTGFGAQPQQPASAFGQPPTSTPAAGGFGSGFGQPSTGATPGAFGTTASSGSTSFFGAANQQQLSASSFGEIKNPLAFGQSSTFKPPAATAVGDIAAAPFSSIEFQKEGFSYLMRITSHLGKSVSFFGMDKDYFYIATETSLSEIRVERYEQYNCKPTVIHIDELDNTERLVGFSPDGMLLVTALVEYLADKDVNEESSRPAFGFGSFAAQSSSKSWSFTTSIKAGGCDNQNQKVKSVRIRNYRAADTGKSSYSNARNLDVSATLGQLKIACSNNKARVVIDSNNCCLIYDPLTGDSRRLPCHLASVPIKHIISKNGSAVVLLYPPSQAIIRQLCPGGSDQVLDIGNALSVDFSPDGTLLAFFGPGFDLAVYQYPSLKRQLNLRRPLKYPAHLCLEAGKQKMTWAQVRFRDNSTIAMLYPDGLLCMWNVKTGDVELTYHCEDLPSDASFWDFIPERDDRIAVWDSKATVKVYQISKAVQGKSNILATHSGTDQGLIARVYDGSIVLSRGFDKPEVLVESLEDHLVTAMHFSPDGDYLAVAFDDWSVDVYDLISKKAVRTLPGHVEEVTCMEWVKLENGSTRLVTGSKDRAFRVWLLPQIPDLFFFGAARVILTSPSCVGVSSMHEGQVAHVATSSIGNQIASVSTGDSNIIHIWTDTGEWLRLLKGHDGQIETLLFLDSEPDILLSGGTDRSVRMWNTKTGECLRILNGASGSIVALTCVEDTGFIVGASYSHVSAWSQETGELIKSESHQLFSSKTPTPSAAFMKSSQHQYLIASSDARQLDYHEVKPSLWKKTEFPKSGDLIELLVHANESQREVLCFKSNHNGNEYRIGLAGDEFESWPDIYAVLWEVASQELIWTSRSWVEFSEVKKLRSVFEEIQESIYDSTELDKVIVQERDRVRLNLRNACEALLGRSGESETMNLVEQCRKRLGILANSSANLQNRDIEETNLNVTLETRLASIDEWLSNRNSEFEKAYTAKLDAFQKVRTQFTELLIHLTPTDSNVLGSSIREQANSCLTQAWDALRKEQEASEKTLESFPSTLFSTATVAAEQYLYRYLKDFEDVTKLVDYSKSFVEKFDQLVKLGLLSEQGAPTLDKYEEDLKETKTKEDELLDQIIDLEWRSKKPKQSQAYRESVLSSLKASKKELSSIRKSIQSSIGFGMSLASGPFPEMRHIMGSEGLLTAAKRDLLDFEDIIVLVPRTSSRHRILKCRQLRQKKWCVLKEFELSKEAANKYFLNEWKRFRDLGLSCHPNIVNVLSCFVTSTSDVNGIESDNGYIEMPFYENGHLWQWYETKNPSDRLKQ